MADDENYVTQTLVTTGHGKHECMNQFVLFDYNSSNFLLDPFFKFFMYSGFA